MGLLQDLLGGVSSGSKPIPSTSKRQSTSESQSTKFNRALSASQQSSLNQALSRGRSASQQNIFQPQADILQNQFLPGISQLFGQDPQSFIAGFNPNQIAGQQTSLDAAQALGGGVIDPSVQAFQSLLGAGGANAPNVQAAIQAATNPIFQNFEERIAPSLRRTLGTDVGQAGGSRGGLQIAKAGQDALRTAGNVGSQIALQAQQQGLGAQQNALNFAPQLAQLFGQPGAVQQGVGAIQQQLAQQQAGAPLDLMSQIQALIGNPTVLGQSISANDSGSLGQSQGSSASANLGFGQSTSRAQSTGQSTGAIPGRSNPLPALIGGGLGFGLGGGPQGGAIGASIGSLFG